jgi:hypothetical protein
MRKAVLETSVKRYRQWLLKVCADISVVYLYACVLAYLSGARRTIDIYGHTLVGDHMTLRLLF